MIKLHLLTHHEIKKSCSISKKVRTNVISAGKITSEILALSCARTAKTSKSLKEILSLREMMMAHAKNLPAKNARNKKSTLTF